jgi:hypothetical protein
MEEISKFISDCLAAQEYGETILPSDHRRLLRLLDLGLVGMDGFKYCWPEVAKENRRIFLASQRP